MDGHKTYLELSQHSRVQQIFLIILSFMMVIGLFYFVLEIMDGFFIDYLNGRIFNDSELMSYSIDTAEPKKITNYYTSWAVDIYVNTPEEARYWFNPILVLFVPLTTIGVSISIILTAFLPQSIGYLKQKIHREIAVKLESIAIAKYGHKTSDGYNEIIDELVTASLKDLHDYSQVWKMSIDDLKILKAAVIWAKSSTVYQIFRANDGVSIYMRAYFTQKYSNTILGFVYIGAAVLIIIIGLRGLKFIPPTQPSLVLFALGLEFSLLITYAVTLIYTPKEEEGTREDSSAEKSYDSLLGTGDFNNAKEVESLLRVFVKKHDKDKI